MSLFESLLRLVDPIEYRQRAAARRRTQDPRPDQPDPRTSVTAPPRATRPAREVDRRCRVCGLAADTAYCLVCLADTMEEGR